MIKPIRVLLLCILIAFALAAAGAEGENGITWKLEDGCLLVEGSGSMENGPLLPDSERSGVRTLRIAEGVTRIGDRAFAGCVNLEEAQLPESLTSVGEDAFAGCEKLETMALPAGITEMNSGSFSDDTAVFLLPSLRTETGVTLGSWGYGFSVPGDECVYIYAFTETNEPLGLCLRKAPVSPEGTVTVAEGVENIEPGFFREMGRVKRIRLPESVNRLSMSSFAGVYRDFVIECVKGSYAEQFALEYGFQYDNGEKQVIGWEITDAEEKVRWVVENYVRPGMTEREKAWVLHNWMITNSHYDEAIEVHESDTILTRGFGVCEAYAFAYYRLLSETGMAVATFSGDLASGSPSGHEWNLVRIDGQWYHVDCTWDDPTMGPEDYPSVSGQETDTYFLKTDAEMAADHVWDEAYSADEGVMHSFYDPELGRRVTLIDWGSTCAYRLDPRAMTAVTTGYVFGEQEELWIDDEMYLELDVYPVISIAEGAFRDSAVLEEVNIGARVQTIGAKAFSGCENLKKIRLWTDVLETVEEGAFEGVSAEAEVICPEGKTETYRQLLTAAGLPGTAVFREEKTGAELLGPGDSAEAEETYVVCAIDEDGNPVPDVTVYFCTDERCVPREAEEDGSIIYSGPRDTYHVQIVSVPGGYSSDAELEIGPAGGEWNLVIRKE